MYVVNADGSVTLFHGRKTKKLVSEIRIHNFFTMIELFGDQWDVSQAVEAFF